MNYRAMMKRIDAMQVEVNEKTVLPDCVFIRKEGPRRFLVSESRHSRDGSGKHVDHSRRFVLTDPRKYVAPANFQGRIIHLYRGGKSVDHSK